MKTQMLKGLLEGCILTIISKEETYGYKICEELMTFGFEELNEGTVYPILTRLEKRGLLIVEKKKSPLGPKRKYYTLSAYGLEYLIEFKKEWLDIRSKVDLITKEEV